MELFTGIKLRDIFLHNNNWWNFYLTHKNLIRDDIVLNVLKMLVCRTEFLGYHLYTCPKCGDEIKVPHSCKGRFCSSCGKKATDNWIKTSFNKLPHTKWQHITFTMPDKLWDFFWVNRHLMNKIPILAANIILKLSKEKKFYPGIFLAIHTFGRALNRNYHLHLSTTIGGLSLNDFNTWISTAYFKDASIKKMWKYEVVNFFRNEYKNNRLTLPPDLKHIKSYKTFNSWLNFIYHKKWVVHLNKQSDNMKVNIDYLGKYIKRPPIGETRILNYDGKNVTYKYLDHYTNTQETMTLPVFDFIARIIRHIPDINFRIIRYYGFLANKVSGKLLPIVYKLLKMYGVIMHKVFTHWQTMIINTFKYDPLKCPFCRVRMQLSKIIFPKEKDIMSCHEKIAGNSYTLIL